MTWYLKLLIGGQFVRDRSECICKHFDSPTLEKPEGGAAHRLHTMAGGNISFNLEDMT